MSHVELERRDHCVLMTLKRTESLNALNLDFLQEIESALDTIENDPSYYVLILTGSEKAFIAGADIKEWNRLSPPRAVEWSQKMQQLNNRIERFRIPVIAAINGFALGGGCELAMACDIRIASEKAKLGQPEVGLGVIAGAGGTQRLPRIVGKSMAKILLYTGRLINAAEAERIGLVDMVVSPDELIDAAFHLGEEIAANGQIAVQETKRVINAGCEVSMESALSLEAQAFALTIGTEDKNIGAGAFIAKCKQKHFVYR